MATIFKLIIEDDEGKTTVYPLSDGSVSIGRKEGNTIRLMERNVSRRHARLLKNNGAVFIEDLDSYNGIRINGERIAGRYEVKEGDLVEIGDYHLALQRAEVQQQAPAANRDGWPQAGTVPDIQLPNDMVQGAERGNRDTVIDQPVPPNVPGAIAQTVEQGALDQPLPPSQPLVKPPPRGESSDGAGLPPFPGPGGMAPPKGPMYGESSNATEAASSDGKLAVGPAHTSSVPRLVCVSTSYAGKEFSLTRPELIIGRVEDNDIVIEHRSVSRNHAKILFDGRTHKIIDLQSANGILVNGEEYAMTDLRKGDLIELGHVRFRFIPADEAFAPTDEEVREMREAGVEPPTVPAEAPAGQDLAAGLLAPPAPAAPAEAPLPAYDPSTAATVTDTPLDALGMGDLAAPSVEAEPTNKPMRATEDERPTQISSVPSDAARPSSAAYAATVPDTPLAQPVAEAEPVSRAPTRLDSEVAAPAEGPKKGLLVVIAALVVTALVLAVLVVSGGGSAQRQQDLQAAFAAENYAKVVEIYEEDPSNFEDPKAVLPLYRKALTKVQSNRGAPPSKPPSSAVDLPAGDADDAKPLEVVTKTAGEPEVALPDGDARPTEATAKRTVRRKPKPKPKKAKRRAPAGNADRLSRDGTGALMQGDLTTAEKLLKKCLRVDPTQASCHRALGVLYAQKDDPQRSISHYRKYVELQPNAVDAKRVREMIRTAEQAVGAESSL